MQLYTQYKTPKPSGGRGGLYWGLLCFVLGFLVWVWWNTGTKSVTPTAVRPSQRPVIPSAGVTAIPASAPPAAVTNVLKTKRPVLGLGLTTAPPPTVTSSNLLPPTVPPGAPTPAFAPRAVQNVYEAQVALALLGISSGSIDGVVGSQTRAALRAFQTKEGLPPTGSLDVVTRARLTLNVPLYLSYTITADDLARLQPVSPTWLGKSLQSGLEYETILELVSEKGHAHPAFVRQLNPGASWTNTVAGTVVRLPNVSYPRTRSKAAFVRIQLEGKQLQAFDSGTNLIAHFPCSIAQRVEKRPIGELHVEAIAPNPNYTFNPEVFPESAEARELNRKLILPPGPNNPVGAAWIGLDRPGYGIHGTPSPEQVGRTESHGCFRLANWNAEYLVRLVSIGTPVFVEP